MEPASLVSGIGSISFVSSYGFIVITLDHSDPLQMTFALKLAVKRSGLTLADFVERLRQDYGVEITQSAVSRNLNRQGIGLQRAMQILAICGETEVEIKR